jgi:hypothetical protein
VKGGLSREWVFLGFFYLFVFFFWFVILVVGRVISGYKFFFSLWANGGEQSVPMNATARSDLQPPQLTPPKKDNSS